MLQWTESILHKMFK